jgi:polysaccharide biosynthesis/export protein
MPNMLHTRLSLLLVLALVAGCGTTGPAPVLPESAQPSEETDYIIAPGTGLNIFVWQHPDLSASVPVRPDGRITTPLIEDMMAAGKTPTQLARDMEEVLSRFIRQPTVNVIVAGASPSYHQQVRVVGQAAQPQALPYNDGMRLLDVMIQVGGLGPFAAGNRAKLVRNTPEGPVEINVRLNDLLNQGDMRQNVVIQPGDVIIIPEARF